MRTLAYLALAVVACGRANTVSTAFTLSTPTTAALTIGIAGTATARDDAAPLGEATAKDLVAELDGRVGALVGVVEALVSQAAQSQSATRVVWVGAQGGLLFRFTMARGGPNRFGWLLEAHAEVAADSAYTTVLAGGIRRNMQAHRGTGYFALDYDHYAAAAAGTATTVTARGRFGAVFVHGDTGKGGGTLLAYALKNYTSGGEAAHSAFYEAVRVDKTALHPALSFYRAGGERDLLPAAAGDAALEESVIIRARRAEGVGGWARGVVFGGNAPAGTAYLFRECWNESNAVAYRRVWSCTIDANAALSVCTFKTTSALAQVGAVDGMPLPSDGLVSNPQGTAEKETLRRLCFSGLGPLLAAAAVAEADPPANPDDTREDLSQAGAPTDDTPAASDSVTTALTADGSAPTL